MAWTPEDEERLQEQENRARKLARDLLGFGVEKAWDMAVEIDENILGGEGRGYRERLKTFGKEGVDYFVDKYARAVMFSAVEKEGAEDKIGTIIDNKIVDTVNEMTPEERQIMADFNAEVAERAYYGTREVPVEGTEAHCIWSNGAEAWFCRDLWETAKKTGKARLDANEIVVRGDPKFLNTHKFLMKPLPLYEFSYEAGERGYVNKREQIMDWAYRQMQSMDIAEREIPEGWL